MQYAAFQEAAQRSSAAVYIVDRERRILLWNAAAERLTGVSEADVLGHWCVDQPARLLDEQGRCQCRRDCPVMSMQRGVTPAERCSRHTQLTRDGTEIEAVSTMGEIRDPRGRAMASFRAWLPTDAPVLDFEALHLADRSGFFHPVTGLPAGWLADRIRLARSMEAEREADTSPLLRLTFQTAEHLAAAVEQIESCVSIGDDVVQGPTNAKADVVLNRIASIEDQHRVADLIVAACEAVGPPPMWAIGRLEGGEACFLPDERLAS